MSQSEINEFRCRLSNIVTIPDDAWEMLAPDLKVIDFAAKSYLIEAGDLASGMYFILKGFVRVFFSGQDGNEYTKAFRLAGELAAVQAALAAEKVGRAADKAAYDSATATATKQIADLNAAIASLKALYNKLAKKYKLKTIK